MAQTCVQAQGPELPARRRAAAPLHGDDRRRRDLPDGRPGLRMYQATRDISKVILWTGLVDPATAAGAAVAVRAKRSDRAVGHHRLRRRAGAVDRRASASCITHKVAGPLYKISSFFGRVRDNRLGPAPPSLRKGDELQEFYSSFREMHQAVRARVEDDVRVLGSALAAIEATPEGARRRCSARSTSCAQLRKRKEDSLEAPPIDRRPRQHRTVASGDGRAADGRAASGAPGLRGADQAEAVQEQAGQEAAGVAHQRGRHPGDASARRGPSRCGPRPGSASTA